MTRNLKAFIIVLLVLGLLIGGYQGSKAYRAAKERADPDYDPPSPFREYISLVPFDREDLVEIYYPGLELRLEKKDDLWTAVPPLPGPLDQREVDSIVWSLTSMSADRIIEENPEDLSIYGLDNPQGRTIIYTAGGERLEFIGGGFSPSRAGNYIMLAGEAKVYLVPVYPASAIYLEPNRLRDKELSGPFTSLDISRLIIENGPSRIDIRAKGEGDLFIPPFSSHVMTAPYARLRGVNSEKFEELAGALQNLRIQEFIDPRPASLAPYGLDKPVRVFLETLDGETSLDLLLGKSENGLLYAQRRGAAEVFTIYEPEDFQRISAFDLMEKFALIPNIMDVDSVTVRGDGPALNGEIRRAGEVETYFMNGRPAEEKSFKGWYQAVIGLLADAEHPDRPQRGTTPEIRVEYFMRNPAGTRSAISLIPYNRDFYALESGGVVEFLISRAQVRAIWEAAEKINYLD